jgi:hypothetical protein
MDFSAGMSECLLVVFLIPNPTSACRSIPGAFAAAWKCGALVLQTSNTVPVSITSTALRHTDSAKSSMLATALASLLAAAFVKNGPYRRGHTGNSFGSYLPPLSRAAMKNQDRSTNMLTGEMAGAAKGRDRAAWTPTLALFFPALCVLLLLIATKAVGAADDAPAAPATAPPAPASVRIQEPPDCPPYRVKPGTPISTPAQTRKVAMQFYAAGKRENVQEMDSTMTADASMWFAGYGCVDRSKWAAAHYSEDRPKSTFVRVELKSLLVEGDKAVLEMLTEQAWPGGGYLKFHSIHLWVSNGKIISVRQYSVDAKPVANAGPMGRAPQTK